MPIVPQLVPRATSASAMDPTKNSIVLSSSIPRRNAEGAPCSSRLPAEVDARPVP